MAPWSSPAEEAQLDVIYMNISFLLLGLYGWEYLSSLGVEYAVLRGRLGFRWPLVSYTVGRVFTFISLLLLAIRSNPPSDKFFCLPTAMFTALAGDIGLGATSINLVIRAWVIWKDSRLVRMLLLILVLGHWVILALDVANLQGAQIGTRCVVVVARPALNGAVFIYSLFLDFLVLVFATVGLSRQTSKSPLAKRLRAQGIVYFAVAMVTYIPPTSVLLVLLQQLQGISCARITVELQGLTPLRPSNIASCRVVRSLLGVRPPEPSQVATEESVENDVALTSQIRVQTTNIVA
ncbi:hypothetical protein V8E55_010468 [Tylopilus felleus]